MPHAEYLQNCFIAFNRHDTSSQGTSAIVAMVAFPFWTSIEALDISMSPQDI